MKNLFIILLFTISLTYGAEIQFIVSRPHSLFYFLDSLSKNHAGDNLRLQFEASSANSKKNRSQIKAYRTLIESLNAEFSVGKYPPKRHSGQKELHKILEIRSMQSQDLDDFSSRIAGLLPNDLHAKFLAALRYWEPIFDDLIWKTHLTQLQKYQATIQENAKKWQLEKLLNQTIHFLQAEWPDDMPFTVSLVPLGKMLAKSTHGHCLGAFAMVEVVLDKMEKDIPDRYGVIAHEFVHSIYYSQSESFQQQFYQWFKANKSDFNMLAYELFNEGMATTVGNGMAYQMATGSVDQGPWYNNTTIDSFAKAINSMTQSYMQKNKPIDKAYINKIVDIYQQLFPRAHFQFDQIFQAIVLLGDNDLFNPKDIMAQIHEFHSLPSVWYYDSIKEPAAQEKIKTLSESVVFVIAQKNREQLKMYQDLVPEISNLIKAAEENKSKSILFATTGKNRRAYMGLLVAPNASLPQILKQVFALKELPQQQITLLK